MSEHWNPQNEVTQASDARVRESWPAGATVGLVVVAAACLAVGVVLYQVAGPRDSFAEEDAATK